MKDQDRMSNFLKNHTISFRWNFPGTTRAGGTLAGLMAYAPLWTVTLGGERPQEIVGELVSCNNFDVLRQKPAIRPGFTALTCEPRGAPPVAKDCIVRWHNQPPT